MSKKSGIKLTEGVRDGAFRFGSQEGGKLCTPE
jgi:hypothetical protein